MKCKIFYKKKKRYEKNRMQFFRWYQSVTFIYYLKHSNKLQRLIWFYAHYILFTLKEMNYEGTIGTQATIKNVLNFFDIVLF